MHGMDESALRQSMRKLLDIDNELYSTRMAFMFCLGISAFLWWIPLLGPAVAGYVCGRKTGSMMKGMLCSLFAGILLLIIARLMSVAVLGYGGFPDVPADQAAAALTGTFGSAAEYLQSYFTAGTAYLNYTGLGVVFVFGGVGGILSRQMRKETAHLISLGAVEGSSRPAARSMLLYSANKEMGFKAYDDCIAAQKMTTNQNGDINGRQKDAKPEAGKVPEGRPVATTVQTVTTTVSGNVAATQSKAPQDKQGSPFSDILERSERKKET
jgi:hypothetical protein